MLHNCNLKREKLKKGWTLKKLLLWCNVEEVPWPPSQLATHLAQRQLWRSPDTRHYSVFPELERTTLHTDRMRETDLLIQTWSRAPSRYTHAGAHTHTRYALDPPEPWGHHCSSEETGTCCSTTISSGSSGRDLGQILGAFEPGDHVPEEE